jgi:hypothetical protein
MTFIKYTITFLAGVYIGQECRTCPSVKINAQHYFEKFKQSEFGKEFLKTMENAKIDHN